MRTQRSSILAISIVFAVMPTLVLAQPSMGTAFTYQGQLRYGGAPLNDTADFEFTLWDDPNSADPNDQVGSTVAASNVSVVRGLFTAQLDFGGNIFTGDARWLEIAVRSPAGGGGFTTLSPRQELTPVPYALYALGSAGLTLPYEVWTVAYNKAVIRIHNDAGSGVCLRGDAGGEDGRGVVGAAGGLNGIGVRGKASGEAPYAVLGEAQTTGAGAVNYGGHFTAAGGAGYGVFGYASDPNGTNYGVFGRSDSTSGYGGYFEGRGYFSDFVGIGTSSPESPLHIAGGNSNLEVTEGDFKIGDETRRLKMGVSLGGPGNGNAFIRIQGGVERLRLGAGTTDVLTIEDTGVGIFELSPATALDVAGTVKTTGFQLTTAPQDGYVLTSSASGVGTWQPPVGGNAWTLTGNAGTDPNSHFLGTSDTQPLVIKTDGLETMRIDTAGNVGVGTSDPQAKLHVDGTAGVDGIMFPDGTLQTTAAAGGGTAWNLTGNVGTDPNTHFLGTTDDVALEMRVNNERALRIEAGGPAHYGNTTANVVTGSSGNLVESGMVGSTIGGGGALYWDPNNYPDNMIGVNRIYDFFATIGGGWSNQIGDPNGVPGGNGWSATIGGGFLNFALDNYATISGGVDNVAAGHSATVSGGQLNVASGDCATVGGGDENFATGDWSTVAGGGWNEATHNYATVGGGRHNSATGEYATVPGGIYNTASGDFSFAGGTEAKAYHAGAFVWADNTWEDFASTVANQFRVRATGGVDMVVDLDPNHGGGLRVLPTEPEPYGHGAPNIIAGYSGNTVADGVVGATISGGGTVMYHPSGGGDFPGLQTVSQHFGTLGGGIANAIFDDPNDPNAAAWCATIGGGLTNRAGHWCATVAGGAGNCAWQQSSSIGGGRENIASARCATVPGGQWNKAAGKCSFAAGQTAKANHDGSFVFADYEGHSPSYEFASAAANEFAVRCTGGARFVSAVSGSTPTAGVQLAAGGTSWSAICDRNLKENFTPVDGQEVLACLAEIPITTWNAKAQDPSIRHMGPVAQDFYATFGLGEDDKHITTVDADGVALAAIQGLYAVVQERDTEIEALRAEKDAEIAALEERLSHMEALLARVAHQDKEDN